MKIWTLLHLIYINGITLFHLNNQQIVNQAWFGELADFHRVNTPTMANLRLPMWCHWMWSWEEKHSSTSSLCSHRVDTKTISNLKSMIYGKMY